MPISKEKIHLERAGRVPPATCGCDGCAGLARRYKTDPDLLAFYRKRLLVMGWAGIADDVEKAYQLAHAPWAKAAQEAGRRSPIGRGQFKRVAHGGEASGAEDEEKATPGAGGQLQRTSQGQDEPSGEEAPAVQGTLPL